MLAILWSGVGIIDLLFQHWRAFQAEKRRTEEEALQKEKQELRRVREVEEREERKEQREMIARAKAQNKERMQESHNRLYAEMAMMAAQREQRENLLDQEMVRLCGLPTNLHRAEIERILSQTPFTVSRGEEVAEGAFWELVQGEEHTLLFLWQLTTAPSISALESLEVLLKDRSATQLYLLCFAEFSVEVVKAVPNLPITLVDPHLLAYWSLEGIKI